VSTTDLPTNVGSNDQLGVSDEYVLTTVLEFADRAAKAGDQHG